MIEALRLDEINIADKFLMMEKLWENMSQDAVNHGFSPRWHFDVLENREKQIKEGKFKFSSIDDVKARLRKTINEE